MTDRSMTYDELAEFLGRTPEAARQIVKRKRWRRTMGNDGKARIDVPVEEIESDPRMTASQPAVDAQTNDPSTDRVKPGQPPVDRPDVAEILTGHIKRLEAAVEVLREERDQERNARQGVERERDQARESERALSLAERTLMIEVAGLRAGIESEKNLTINAEARSAELKAERDRWAEQASRSWWKRLIG